MAEQELEATDREIRDADTKAALESLDEWGLRQYQEMGPPDVKRAKELYRDGEVDEQELDVLIESAMQYYPPDGVCEKSNKQQSTRSIAEKLYEILKIGWSLFVVITGALFILVLFLIAYYSVVGVVGQYFL